MKTTPIPPQAARLCQALLEKTTAGLCAGFALFAAQSAQAANGTWSGATSNSWAAPGNWSSLPGSADIATFNTAPGSTIDLGAAAQSVKSLLFDTATGSFTFNTGGAGGQFNLTGGGNITLASTATGTGLVQTVNAPVSLGGNYAFTNSRADAASALVFTGNITNSAASTLTLSGAGTGTGNAISGNIGDGTGAQAVTFTASAGKWTLSGANSYSGTTTFSGAGSLVLSGTNSSFTGQTTTSSGSGILLLNNADNGGLARGTFNLNGGGIQSGVADLVLANNFIQQGTPLFSGANNITIRGSFTNSTGNRTLTSSMTGGKTLTLAGNVYLSESTGAGRTWSINGSGNTLISGVISDANGTGTAGNLTIINSGVTTLANPNNSYTGKTTIGSAAVAAIVRVSKLANGGANSGIGASGGAAANLQFVNASTFQYTGDTVVTDREFSLGVNTNMIIDVTNAGANLTMKGDTGAVLNNQSVAKAGAGTLTYTGVQTYTGATTVNGGTLALDMNAGGAFASTSALALGGGTLEIKGASNAASAQTMGNLTLSANTNNGIKLTSGGSGGTLALTLGNTWSRANGSTLNIDLSSPGAVLASAPITSAASQTATTGVVGYATVTDGSGTGFATVINNNVVRYTGAATLTSTSDSSNSNFVTKVGDAGYSGNTLTMTSGLHRMVSLQLDTSGGAGVLDLSANTANSLGTNFLITGNNDFTIQNGLVGNTANGGRETIIHQYGTGTFTVAATVGVSTNTLTVTKDGPGTLVFTAANPYTGATIINGGVFRATDGIGLPTASLLTLNNGVFETNAAAFTRAVGSAAGNIQVTGGRSGFSAHGGPVAVSLGGTGTETQLVWGSANFNPGVFVLNERTANNTIDLKNAIDLAGSTRTVRVNADAASAARINGVISSSQADGALVKDGIGTLILANSNTYTGLTTVKEGALAMGANNVFAAGNFNLAGGTLAVGTFQNASVGTLALTANSTITLGSGGVFAFADSSALDWSTYSLSITGSFADGESIRFGTDAGGLTGGQLAKIFINGFGGVTLDDSGYLVASAVPEPATCALLGGVAVLLGAVCARRRRQPAGV